MKVAFYIEYVPTGKVLYNEIVDSKDYPGQENATFEELEELFKMSTSYLSFTLPDKWNTTTILREEVVRNCIIKLSKLED